MGFINLKDGEKIFFRDQGSGPPVVLIHGWPLSGDMWEYQTMPLVEDGFRVITYDRRGFGRSSQPAGGYNYDTFANDLCELINQLELQQCALVGFSMGGGEIARYISRFGSAKISKVALISSVVPYLLKDDSNSYGVEESVFQNMVEGLRKDRPHFLKNFAKDFYGVGALSHPVSDEILDWSQSLALVASPKATIDCVWAFAKTNFRGDCRSFDIPTLIIHGTSDRTVPFQVGEAAAAAIPGAQLIPYHGAPHGLFMTHKDDLERDLTSFLEADVSNHWIAKPEIVRGVDLGSRYV